MIDTSKLSGAVRARRGARSLRDVEAEAGVSFKTLARVEGGHTPDLTSFMRLCEWLGVPMDFFRAEAKETA